MMLPPNEKDKLHFTEITFLRTIIGHPINWFNLMIISGIWWSKGEKLLRCYKIARSWKIRAVSAVKAFRLLLDDIMRWWMMLLFFRVEYLFHRNIWVFVSRFVIKVGEIAAAWSDFTPVELKIVPSYVPATNSNVIVVVIIQDPAIFCRTLLSSLTVTWAVSSDIVFSYYTVIIALSLRDNNF